MTYVNGMIAAVPAANKQAYLDMAKSAAAVFKEHGALAVVENWGVDVPEGKKTSMPMAVQKKDDEVIVFSWITWPSKEVADAGMKAAMGDPRMPSPANPMPFDGSRLIFGGFETILDV